MTTKILALADALGNMADFCLLPGQAHDLRGMPELIKALHADHMLADRAFDADWLWKSLSEHASCLHLATQEPQIPCGLRQRNVQMAASG